MDLAATELDVTVTESAGAVHRSQRPTLGPGGETLGSPDVDWYAVGADDDRRETSVAAHAAHRVGRQHGALIGLAQTVLVDAVGKRGLVDHDEYVGLEPPHRMVATGDEVAERFGGELGAIDVGARRPPPPGSPPRGRAPSRCVLRRSLRASPSSCSASWPTAGSGGRIAGRRAGRLRDQLVLATEELLGHCIVELGRGVRQRIGVLGGHRALASRISSSNGSGLELLAQASVDALAQQVGVAHVAGVLLDHSDQHLA